jgi:hypothetical protein
MRTMSMIGIACSLLASSCLREAQGTSSKKPERAGYVSSARAARTAEPSRAAPLAIGPLDCDGAARLRSLPRLNLAALQNASLGSMERVPFRTTGSAITLSGWRMEIASSQGKGAIFAIGHRSGTCYVGHGVFSDWPRTELERVYRRFAPQEKSADLGTGQLD